VVRDSPLKVDFSFGRGTKRKLHRPGDGEGQLHYDHMINPKVGGHKGNNVSDLKNAWTLCQEITMGWGMIRDANGHVIKTIIHRDTTTKKEKDAKLILVQENMNTECVDAFLKPVDDGLLLQSKLGFGLSGIHSSTHANMVSKENYSKMYKEDLVG
jgi:hypothetical protein